jgi:hypothetical protein
LDATVTAVVVAESVRRRALGSDGSPFHSTFLIGAFVVPHSEGVQADTVTSQKGGSEGLHFYEWAIHPNGVGVSTKVENSFSMT